MKRFAVLALAATALITGLAACGENDPREASPAAAAVAAPQHDGWHDAAVRDYNAKLADNGGCQLYSATGECKQR